MNFIFTAILIFTLPTFASISISKEYSFSPSMLTAAENFLQKAAARAPEVPKFPVFNSLDQTNGVSMWCPPLMPKTDGTGCFMNFTVQSEAFSLIIKKRVSLTFSSQQVIDQLKTLDPNATEDHQQFGSLFETKDTFGSHYYCQPEGDVPNKQWHCYLFVSESFEK